MKYIKIIGDIKNKMLSIDQLKQIDPKLKTLTDEELELVRYKLYELGQFAFEEWLKSKNNPKNKAVPTYPVRLSLSTSGSCRM